MKRAMGLVLAVLAFAVVAHADKIECGGWNYATGAGTDLQSPGLSAEVLHSSNPLLERGSIAFHADRAFVRSDETERLTDYVFYSHFGDSEEVVEGPVEFDSIRRRLDGILGDRYEWGVEYPRTEHPEPFHRSIPGLQEVPEPGTLLMMGMGLAALAIWKRRNALYADSSESAH
jgi:hypothetical protein